jgi:hypothetical protein
MSPERFVKGESERTNLANAVWSTAWNWIATWRAAMPKQKWQSKPPRCEACAFLGNELLNSPRR